MPSFVSAFSDAARAVICATAGAGASALDWVVERVRAATGLPIPGAAVALAQGVLSAFCDVPPGYSYTGDIPYTGGQCAAPYVVEYAWEWYYTDGFGFDQTGRSPGGGGTSTQNVAGPLGAPFVDVQPGVSVKLILPTAAGNVTLSSSGFSAANTFNGYQLLTFNVSRTDGNPDDCGNLAPSAFSPKPPEATSGPVTINYNDNGGSPLSVTVPFIDFEGFGLDVNGELNLYVNLGGITFQFRPGESDGRPSAFPPSLDPEDESPGTERILLGVFYTVETAPAWASFQYVEAGVYYIPRAGSIRFVGDSEQGEEIELHGESGYIENPDRATFDSYINTSLPGFVISFRPSRVRLVRKPQLSYGD